MTVYLGKNPVGVGRIVEKKVAKTKFGASVDSFLGDVDADGNYVKPSESFEVNLAGVKKAASNDFNCSFYRNEGITKFIANDLIQARGTPFSQTAYAASNLEEVHIDSLEVLDVSVSNCFYQAFGYCTKLKKATFAKLKSVLGGGNVFYGCFAGVSLNVSEVFPSLEEIAGVSAFDNFIKYNKDDVITFLKIKKITGGQQSYNSTFGSFYAQNTVWNFPSATEFTGYIWNVGASYAGEIHFAAANQAAIEACEGYSYKWGFQNATIFFDL